MSPVEGHLARPGCPGEAPGKKSTLALSFRGLAITRGNIGSWGGHVLGVEKTSRVKGREEMHPSCSALFS